MLVKYLKLIFSLIIMAAASVVYASGSNKPLPYQHFTPALKEKQLKQLTPEQRYITQHNGTEPAGSGKYYNFFKPGIYVDVVSGEPLFSSVDKYQADSGWPAFTKPITKNALKITTKHHFLGFTRYEVSSRIANSHLGDLFLDRFVKHPPHNGQVLKNNSDRGLTRYCIDSAALKFIPLVDMKKLGYGAYIKYVLPKSSSPQP